MGHSVGVLLASGRGTRFGGDKLMHPLNNGRPIVVQSALNLLAASAEVWAVVPAQHPALHAALSKIGCHLIINPNPATGMGGSVAQAVKHWQSRPDTASVLIALGDMPFVQVNTLQRLHGELNGGAGLCAPVFNGKRGQPVGFSKEWQAQLMSLKGDVGARELLQKNQALLKLIPVNDPGIHLDIDTPSDLAGIQPR